MQENPSFCCIKQTKGGDDMRLKVKYRLSHRIGERYVLETYDRYSIIDVEEVEDETEMHNRIKKELSREIGRPSNDFKILGYSEF
jgi:hypothetical protein